MRLPRQQQPDIDIATKLLRLALLGRRDLRLPRLASGAAQRRVIVERRALKCVEVLQMVAAHIDKPSAGTRVTQRADDRTADYRQGIECKAEQCSESIAQV